MLLRNQARKTHLSLLPTLYWTKSNHAVLCNCKEVWERYAQEKIKGEFGEHILRPIVSKGRESENQLSRLIQGSHVAGT